VCQLIEPAPSPQSVPMRRSAILPSSSSSRSSIGNSSGSHNDISGSHNYINSVLNREFPAPPPRNKHSMIDEPSETTPKTSLANNTMSYANTTSIIRWSPPTYHGDEPDYDYSENCDANLGTPNNCNSAGSSSSSRRWPPPPPPPPPPLRPSPHTPAALANSEQQQQQQSAQQQHAPLRAASKSSSTKRNSSKMNLVSNSNGAKTKTTTQTTTSVNVTRSIVRGTQSSFHGHSKSNSSKSKRTALSSTQVVNGSSQEAIAIADLSPLQRLEYALSKIKSMSHSHVTQTSMSTNNGGHQPQMINSSSPIMQTTTTSSSNDHQQPWITTSNSMPLPILHSNTRPSTPTAFITENPTLHPIRRSRSADPSVSRIHQEEHSRIQSKAHQLQSDVQQDTGALLTRFDSLMGNVDSCLFDLAMQRCHSRERQRECARNARSSRSRSRDRANNHSNSRDRANNSRDGMNGVDNREKENRFRRSRENDANNYYCRSCTSKEWMVMNTASDAFGSRSSRSSPARQVKSGLGEEEAIVSGPRKSANGSTRGSRRSSCNAVASRESSSERNSSNPIDFQRKKNRESSSSSDRRSRSGSLVRSMSSGVGVKDKEQQEVPRPKRSAAESRSARTLRRSSSSSKKSNNHPSCENNVNDRFHRSETSLLRKGGQSSRRQRSHSSSHVTNICQVPDYFKSETSSSASLVCKKTLDNNYFDGNRVWSDDPGKDEEPYHHHHHQTQRTSAKGSGGRRSSSSSSLPSSRAKKQDSLEEHVNSISTHSSSRRIRLINPNETFRNLEKNSLACKNIFLEKSNGRTWYDPGEKEPYLQTHRTREAKSMSPFAIADQSSYQSAKLNRRDANCLNQETPINLKQATQLSMSSLPSQHLAMTDAIIVPTKQSQSSSSHSRSSSRSRYIARSKRRSSSCRKKRGEDTTTSHTTEDYGFDDNISTAKSSSTQTSVTASLSLSSNGSTLPETTTTMVEYRDNPQSLVVESGRIYENHASTARDRRSSSSSHDAGRSALSEPSLYGTVLYASPDSHELSSRSSRIESNSMPRTQKQTEKQKKKSTSRQSTTPTNNHHNTSSSSNNDTNSNVIIKLPFNLMTGKCNYHPTVCMAVRNEGSVVSSAANSTIVVGGWKIVRATCPKCTYNLES